MQQRVKQSPHSPAGLCKKLLRQAWTFKSQIQPLKSTALRDLWTDSQVSLRDSVYTPPALMEQIKHSPASARHVCLVLSWVFRGAGTMTCWGYMKCRGVHGTFHWEAFGNADFFPTQNPYDIECDMHSDFRSFLSQELPRYKLPRAVLSRSVRVQGEMDNNSPHNIRRIHYIQPV